MRTQKDNRSQEISAPIPESGNLEGLRSLLENLELMSKEELLTLGNFVDTLLIEKELENRRSMPEREALETRRLPGALLRLEVLRFPDGSTSGPYWSRYFFQDGRQLGVRYLGESLPDEEASTGW